jgi:hypothetical protein
MPKSNTHGKQGKKAKTEPAKPVTGSHRSSVAQEKSKALDAVSHLLRVDLDKITNEQLEYAEEAVRAKPGIWTLVLSMKKWAHALADEGVRWCARIFREISCAGQSGGDVWGTTKVFVKFGVRPTSRRAN